MNEREVTVTTPVRLTEVPLLLSRASPLPWFAAVAGDVRRRYRDSERSEVAYSGRYRGSERGPEQNSGVTAVS